MLDGGGAGGVFLEDDVPFAVQPSPQPGRFPPPGWWRTPATAMFAVLIGAAIYFAYASQQTGQAAHGAGSSSSTALGADGNALPPIVGDLTAGGRSPSPADLSGATTTTLGAPTMAGALTIAASTASGSTPTSRHDQTGPPEADGQPGADPERPDVDPERPTSTRSGAAAPSSVTFTPRSTAPVSPSPTAGAPRQPPVASSAPTTAAPSTTASAVSTATTVSTVAGPQRNPGDPPRIANPGQQFSVVGRPASYQLIVSSEPGDTLTYSASGLPNGLTINTRTGLISGTPTTVQTRSVQVTVTGSTGTANQGFTWAVTA